jgi:transposase
MTERARGRAGGRPMVLAPGQRQRVVELYQAKQLTVKEICEVMGISKPTLYAYVRQTQASSLLNGT